MTILKNNLLLFLFLFFFLPNYGQIKKKNSYLVQFTDSVTDESGYKNPDGNIVIQAGKYSFCFTDTFRAFAIVAKPHVGFVAIDRQENILYKVFPFDNGPDYPSDGLFRITKNNKFGYADAITGTIKIIPQFGCAFPFENGIAKVGLNCVTHPEGEHFYWTSKNWFFINKKGRRVKAPGLKK